MKVINYSIPVFALVALFLISACDHRVDMATVVHEDGKIDKMITLTGNDSSHVDENYFGIGPAVGWTYELDRVPEEDGDDTDLRITFRKSFQDVEMMNAELNREADTLFRIESTFKKKFRWFYTYLEYAETIKAADRFKQIDQQAYFTPEEYSFIDRLPAEGSLVSKADSLFAENLNKKIFDEYSRDAILAEHFAYMKEKFREYGLGADAERKLEEKREEIVAYLLEIESEDEDAFIPVEDELNFINIIDSLVVELPRPRIDQDYETFNEAYEKRLSFMSWVGDGKFTNQIEMPWKLISSNADSVMDNRLNWYPPTMKFLLTDYRMEAESRKLNIWTVAVSILVILFTLILYIRRK